MNQCFHLFFYIFVSMTTYYRLFQIALSGGVGESEILVRGDSSSGGGNLKRSDFDILNLF